jgi:class 3 adenylate cyclase
MNLDQDKPHILYVDDEENNLIALKAAFRRHYRVHTATSAREGVDILKNQPVQLIITDQRMPEMTGVQFLEAVQPEYPDTIRMVLTGFSDVDAIIKAINTGRVYRYVTKPWDEVELKMTIDGGLKLFQAHQENKKLENDLQARVREQDRIIELFKKYVPEHVIKETLNADATDSSLVTGESRIISVLFSGIQNFQTVAAGMAPEKLVAYLNEYFSVMTACVRAHKGSVNKFIGDGMLALFGAPISHIENQENAVECALTMIEQLEGFNESHRDKNGVEISIGVGINTGEVIVGNMGSDDRLEYTAIGDTVNVASRISTLTKGHSNCILVSDSTYQIVRSSFLAEAWPPQTVKGKSDPIIVHQIKG